MLRATTTRLKKLSQEQVRWQIVSENCCGSTSQESLSSHRDFLKRAKRSYLVNNKDDNVKIIFNTASDWGASLLISELKHNYDLLEDTLQEREKCTCNFSKMFGMGVCHHVFYHRLQQGQDVLNKTDYQSGG
ncbi:uncharacterized protein LOC113212266 isoform X2 [Frankliniella occidentalis]|uniref:Uncharacterized protein LOC113212266 isoform X2 n=1 Tax=Frankliniella occidentalis TaxID=133901 RepID=A0A9C6X3W3_FRAOC|nr:uncharacterized protein LOC113212266 isoform X2 [Frankliniella occidentalis]